MAAQNQMIPTKEPLDPELVGKLVRYWVHYDNKIAELNKEVKRMRDMKYTYEQQILSYLANSTLANPVIQIGGGRIIVGQDKSQQPLSYTMLESTLTKYYALKPGSKNETSDILKFIREQRTSQISSCLKRILNPTSRSRRGDTADGRG
jgi:hypothetical protein